MFTYPWTRYVKANTSIWLSQCMVSKIMTNSWYCSSQVFIRWTQMSPCSSRLRQDGLSISAGLVPLCNHTLHNWCLKAAETSVFSSRCRGFVAVTCIKSCSHLAARCGIFLLDASLSAVMTVDPVVVMSGRMCKCTSVMKPAKVLTQTVLSHM